MLINQKVYVFATDTDFNKSQVSIHVNGKDEELGIKHLFISKTKDRTNLLELEAGKITGYSLLQYYQPKDGGLIDKEGNIITFMIGDKKLNLTLIRDGLVFQDAPVEVNLQYVKDVADVLHMKEPEKTIYALSNSEKKLLVLDREEEFSKLELQKKEEELKANEEKKLAEAKAAEEEAAKKKEEEERKKQEEEFQKAEAEKKAKEEAEKAEQAKKEAEAEAEKQKEVDANKIPSGDDIMTEKQYRLRARQYKNAGFNEFKQDKYILFYGSDVPDSFVPFMVANMGNYYKLLEGSVLHDDELSSKFEYEFTNEEGKDKIAILKEGHLDITDL